ncbi:unnamed protein product [Rotaria sp. Silwood2]|nr:unnamed protein product [Rotaria sp. Silwood2]CAF3409142.1 unnamed protein product [Rotaria sp. Silwood2]CAF4115257.1 unnamed protein product [Rotaria sp. Silwood2]CAF4465891.1 unnamed protein product [Rotaria sp. Silwood2]
MVERLPDHVTPKVHFLTEYCRLIENHGLPVLNTCIRFESKHQYFKQFVNRGLNFKNPLLTMFKRHQLRQCFLNKIESSHVSSSTTVHSFKSVDISKFSLPIQCLLKKEISESEKICESSSVYYHDLNIKQKSVFVHDLLHTEEIPVFCQIHHLLRIKEKWFAIAEQLHTNSFNEHLCAYEVEYTGTLVEIDVEHCLDIFSDCLDIYEIEETYYINMLTHEDIDGATLVLLQPDDIVKIFPRLRDRVKFVDQRTKLVEKFKECRTDADEFTGNLLESTLSSSTLSLYFSDVPRNNGSPDLSVLITTEVNQNDEICDDTSPNIDCHDSDDNHVESRLPTDYTGPILSSRIQYFIDQNNIAKFNPHTTLRAEILSLIFDDVTKTHNLLYPNHDEYMMMAKSIVQKLSIPSGLVCEATKEWHESIKQKFKRERRPLQMENELAQKKKDTYGNGKTNGRPKRKSVVVQAERRTNDVPFINLNDNHDENLSSLVNQMKIELLKDDPDTDILHNIWRQSFNIRRLHVRQLPIDELLSRFPGYRRPDLLLAEVQETAGVDLVENVKDILPKLFDCIPDNNCFLSDVLPIRVIRVLCKKFGDSVGNVFTHDEVLVSYPCIKILDNKFELYLDFHLITETDSCSTALALLLSLYYVFEIRFASHNRCCRLLYSILFEDTHHLNKSLKKLLNDWNYKIINRPLTKRQASVMNITESFTQPSTDNENVLSSSNNLTQIDHLTYQQSQQVRSCSTPSKEITSENIQHHLSRDHENDNDQQSDADDSNMFNHLSNVSIPIIDSELNSPTIPQNKSQSSTNNPALTDDFHLSQTNELYSLKNPLISKENRTQSAPAKEQTKSSINLKRKRKQDQATPSITFPKQSTRNVSKRTRVQ